MKPNLVSIPHCANSLHYVDFHLAADTISSTKHKMSFFSSCSQHASQAVGKPWNSYKGWKFRDEEEKTKTSGYKTQSIRGVHTCVHEWNSESKFALTLAYLGHQLELCCSHLVIYVILLGINPWDTCRLTLPLFDFFPAIKQGCYSLNVVLPFVLPVNMCPNVFSFCTPQTSMSGSMGLTPGDSNLTPNRDGSAHYGGELVTVEPGHFKVVMPDHLVS